MTVKRFTILFLIMAIFISAPAFSKDRVAVLDFEAKDIEGSDAMAIADLFRSDLVATGEFIVLERGNMQSILNEHELQMKGLTNEASASEIGELLAVNYLFLGNLSKFGNKFLLVIDKINVKTGEIEKSVKKSGVNLDAFLDLSMEAAAEMTDTSTVVATVESDGYEPATLIDYVNQIGIFQLLEFSTLDVNTKKMQATDLQIRKDIFTENKKNNAVIEMIVNAVTFGIGGNFMQGFDELAWTSVGTTAALGVSIALKNVPLIVTTAILYTGTYALGVISPFMYEAEYNQYMKDTLLVY